MAGRLRVGIVLEIDKVDPHRSMDHAAMLVERQVFENLYRRSEGRAVPDLLVRDLRLVEGQYEGKLREGVCFSNGTPLSAELVRASLVRCPVVPDDLECSGEGTTLRLSANHQLAELRDMLSSPMAAIATRDASGAVIGTGPFALESHEAGLLRLGRNAHAPSQPSLEGVDFVSFPSEMDLAQAVARGEIDFTSMLAPGELPKGSFIRSSYVPTPSTALLWINVERVPDPRVRRAIAHAIDRARLLQLAYPGVAGLGAVGVSPRALGTFADALPHDPGRSRELLAAVGGDAPHLHMRVIWAARPYLPAPRAAATEIIEQLERVGLHVDLEMTQGPADWQRTGASGEGDLVLGGWYADDPSLAFFLSAIYGSKNIAQPGESVMGCNFSRWHSERADTLLAKIRATGASAAIEELVEHVRAEAPVIALHHGAMMVALGSRVRAREFDELSVPIFSSFTVWT